MSETAKPSLRDVMRSALDDQIGDDDVQAMEGASAAPEASVDAEGEGGGDLPKEPEKAAKPGPARAENGKFLKSAESADNEQPEPKQVDGAAETPSEPIRVPSSLPAPLKARFAELAPEWREAILKRDEDANAAKAQWDTKAAKFNRYEEILAPHRDAWVMQGIPDEVAAIQMLVTAEKMLREDPQRALVTLAQSYGVSAQGLVQLVSGAQAGPQPGPQPSQGQIPPQFLADFQTLKQRLDEQDAQSRAAGLATAQAEIDAFVNDPANPYFENVKGAIGVLLETGQATTLKEAYEKATWADPEIRVLLQRQTQAAEKAKQVQEAARKKAAAADRASGSVTGSPTGGANSAPGGGSRKPLNQIIREASEDIGFRAI